MNNSNVQNVYFKKQHILQKIVSFSLNQRIVIFIIKTEYHNVNKYNFKN